MSSDSNVFRLSGLGSFGAALAAGRVSQAAAFFVMAHILGIEDMANVALLSLIYMGLFQFTNMGFDRYIIYSKETSPTELDASIDAIWTMQFMRGVIILAAAAIASWYFVRSGQYDLGYAPFFAIGFSVVILSVLNPGLSVFERAGNFAVVARARGVSAVVGAVASIAMVMIWKTPWAYVIGQLINAASLTALSFIFVARMPRLSFSMTKWASIFRYCKHLLIIAVVSFVAVHGQNFYIAAVLPPATLSAYFVWYRLVSLPGEFITQISNSVLFAQASDDARQGHAIARAHLRGFTVITVLIVPIHLFLWLHGDVVIQLIAGADWVGYWWGGRLMILANLCLVLSGTVGPFMLVHLPHVSSIVRTGEAVATVILIITLGRLYQDFGVLIAVLAVMTAALIIRIMILYTRLLSSGRRHHALVALAVLGIVAAPLFTIEAAILLIGNPSTQVILAAIGYVLISGGAACLIVCKHGELIKVFP